MIKGKTRCHPYISDLQTFYAVSSAAIAAELGVVKDPQHRSHMILACRAANADVALPLDGYVQAALSGDVPKEIIVRIEEKGPEPGSVSVKGMDSISTRICAALFALFVETGNEWLKRNYKKDAKDWPPVSNFCRIVRNAIVHGGKINLNSETAVGGRWRHLNYNHRHNGKAILNDGDLSIGDLIILMFEMELELNELGAPFDLG